MVIMLLLSLLAVPALLFGPIPIRRPVVDENSPRKISSLARTAPLLLKAGGRPSANNRKMAADAKVRRSAEEAAEALRAAEAAAQARARTNRRLRLDS